MYRDAGAWHALMGRLARAVDPLSQRPDRGRRPVRADCSTVGSAAWARTTTAATCCRTCARSSQALTPGVPVIHFATGNPALLPLLGEAGGAVIGVDWRIRLDDAWNVVGHDQAVQGNLDPAVLLANPAEIRRRAQEILDQAAGRPGHIFNLGHGVLPQTPVDTPSRWSTPSTS